MGCSNQTKKNLPADTVAYGNLNFGVKESEYLKKYKDSTVMIENGVYQLKPFFIPHDHRLYMLHLISESRHTADITPFVIDDMNTLVNKMISVYGNPTIYLKMGDTKQLEPNKVSWYCRWILKNKLILIGTARIKDDDTYYRDNRNYVAVCEITNVPLKAIANTQILYLEF